MRLQTDTLVVRPFEAADAQALLAYANDPQVIGPAGMRALTTPEEAAAFIARSHDEHAIVLAGRVVGQIGIYPRAADGPDGRTRELGYALARRYWGRGVMTAVLQLVLAELRRTGITEVWAGVFPDNQRSVALLIRTGFTYRFTVPLALALTPGAPRREAYYSQLLENENKKTEM
ncbi:GNAT family N-acetyltransferase [Lacticaseibacillus absianus]|uniref:GNAT family N-acetyltransferase n=1 Tax=Lacticaseibacillus absianus TaxID=2729623 RepID=UPI0015C8973F|nr:GNAT family N-acetyltransferase [Lacticaseibacillus absianus]